VTTSGVPTGTWRELNASWLAASLVELRLRLHRHALTIRDEASVAVTDWIVAQDAGDGRVGAARQAELELFDARIATATRTVERLEAAMGTDLPGPALRVLSELAGLSRFEEQVLLMAAAPSFDGAFSPAYAQVHADARLDHATLHLALALYAHPGERLAFADALMPSRGLRRLRLVEVSPDVVTGSMLRALTVDERVVDYLRGHNRMAAELEPYLVQVGDTDGIPDAAASARSLEDLAVAITALLQRDDSRWPTLDLVGSPDAGATDGLALACRRLGLNLHALRTTALATLDARRRTEVVALLGREALMANLALVVDATSIDRGSDSAVLVDELIATVAAPLFVLSAEPWPDDTGSLDKVPVRRPTRTEQRSLWRTALANHPNTVNGEVDAIVQQFDLGPKAISEIVAGAARQTDASISGRALWDACRDRTGAGLEELARRIDPTYDWEDIVVADDVLGQLHELSDQVEQRGRVYERWGFGAKLGRGRGITALFAGPSGTGKTMAAEILARHLRLDLQRIDLAGVVSKYIGETEKNLRRVFDAAEASGAILLFDEADALFGTRTEVRDSHDRYANLEINYLLQRMEDYAGLAILATNRRAALDTAFLRRLRFVIEFPFPGADERRRIWEGVFPLAVALDDIDHGALSRLELSGGNIRTIALNAAFLAAADDSPIGMSHLMRAAAREYAKLAQPVSSAEFGSWVTVARG
jgi:hypothetical protein